MQDWLTNIKNPFLFVSGLMLLAACVFYTLYRFKSRVARALEKEIKEHKQTAEKLQDSEEKFRILTEKSMAGICMIQHNAIKYANPKFLEMFAYTREEMIDKPCIELVYAPDRPMMEEILAQRMTDTGDTVSCQFRGLTKKNAMAPLPYTRGSRHYLKP